MKISKRSQKKLSGVHPQLTVFTFLLMSKMNELKEKNLNHTDFSVISGYRNKQEQEELIKKGFSKSLDSYHRYGLAVDIIPYIKNVGGTYDDVKFKNEWDILLKIAKDVILENKLEIQNGFDIWSWDKAHFQMSGFKNKYDIRKIIN
jgi:hypothetical protein